MSLENKLDQATGAIKEGFGKVTGDSKTEAEGTVEKTVAKAKEVVEDAKGAVPLKVLKIHLRKKIKKIKGMFPLIFL